MSKVAIICLHPKSGCYQYSVELISRFTVDKDVFMNSEIQENNPITKYHKIYCYSSKPRIIRALSLVYLLLRLFLGGLLGYYKCVLVMGLTQWDHHITKIARLTIKNVLFVVHDGLLHKGEENDYLQNCIIKCINNSTQIVYLSEFVRKQVETELGLIKPYIIVPHGLINYGGVEKINRRFSIPKKLLFLGRISPYKGVENLIEALDYVSNDYYSELLVAGKSNYELPNFKNNKVTIVDKWLTEKEIIDYILWADILILPYLEGTQSGVITLAVNYLLPTIVTNIGGFKEQFDDAAIFIKESSPKEISCAINELCRDEGKYMDIYKKLTIRKAALSWDKIAADFNKVLLQINNG